MTTEVLIVGGGPNGLLLACELALAGVQPVVLEKLRAPDTMPKANGLVGRVVQALDYRGLYATLSGSTTPPQPTPAFQFGALNLHLAALEERSLYLLPIPQRRLQELLAARGKTLGVEIRRGSEVTALTQTADQVIVEVQGPHRRPYTFHRTETGVFSYGMFQPGCIASWRSKRVTSRSRAASFWSATRRTFILEPAARP